jgi:hypothetical protein
MYEDAVLTAQEGASAFRSMRTGDDLDRAVTTAACRAIDAMALQDANASVRVGQLKFDISSALPSWVAAEPTGRVDGSINKAATALTIGEPIPEPAYSTCAIANSSEGAGVTLIRADEV